MKPRLHRLCCAEISHRWSSFVRMPPPPPTTAAIVWFLLSVWCFTEKKPSRKIPQFCAGILLYDTFHRAVKNVEILGSVQLPNQSQSIVDRRSITVSMSGEEKNQDKSHDRDVVTLPSAQPGLSIHLPACPCNVRAPETELLERSASHAQRLTSDTPENPNKLSHWASELLFPIWLSASAAIWLWVEDGPPSWALRSHSRVELWPTSNRLWLCHTVNRRLHNDA